MLSKSAVRAFRRFSLADDKQEVSAPRLAEASQKFSGSVPRAVASAAYGVGYWREPRSLPLAVLIRPPKPSSARPKPNLTPKPTSTRSSPTKRRSLPRSAVAPSSTTSPGSSLSSEFFFPIHLSSQKSGNAAQRIHAWKAIFYLVQEQPRDTARIFSCRLILSQFIFRVSW